MKTPLKILLLLSLLILLTRTTSFDYSPVIQTAYAEQDMVFGQQHETEESQIMLLDGSYVVGGYQDMEMADKSLLGGKYGELPPILLRIRECESGDRADVCSYAGCGAGMGLFQLIPTAVQSCEKHFNKKIDPFNSQDNTQCALWMYKTRGTSPWGFEGATWGSFNCWGKFLKNQE